MIPLHSTLCIFSKIKIKNFSISFMNAIKEACTCGDREKNTNDDVHTIDCDGNCNIKNDENTNK